MGYLMYDDDGRWVGIAELDYHCPCCPPGTTYDHYQVSLVSYTDKVSAVKKIRQVLDLSLPKALTFINNLPEIIIPIIPDMHVQRTKEEYEAVGCILEFTKMELCGSSYAVVSQKTEI